jgi:hypothetical protein
MRHRLPVAVALLISLFIVPAFSQIYGAHCANVCSSGFSGSDKEGQRGLHSQVRITDHTVYRLDDPVLVEVIGVGFLDRMHRQRRRALPSGVGLHLVISFKALE